MTSSRLYDRASVISPQGETIDEYLLRTNRRFFSRSYANYSYKSDSPEQSRISLLKNSRMLISELNESDCVLDLGAGKQVFERQYFNAYGKPSCNIVTLDIAELDKYQLLVGGHERTTHIIANGAILPFNHDVFSLIISNMALDFMPDSAKKEVYRVLKPGGHALINLHHPFLIPDNIDDLLNNRKLKEGCRIRLEFWKYLKEHGILFESSEKIRGTFTNYGFTVDKIAEVGDGRDKWWEVELNKT